MIRTFLRDRMKKLGWTRYRLASEAGIDHRVVCRFFGGGSTTVENIDAMIEAAGGRLVYRVSRKKGQS